MDQKSTVSSGSLLVESKLNFRFKDLANAFVRDVEIKQIDALWSVQVFNEKIYLKFRRIGKDFSGDVVKYKLKMECDQKNILDAPLKPIDTSWIPLKDVDFWLGRSDTVFEITITIRLERASILSNIPSFVKDIKKIFNEAAFSDFTFIVQGKEFKVHRNILGFASPVMMNLFTTEMAEKQRQVCEVTDIAPDIFEIMLHFIYYGKTPENIQRIAKDLYEAAHYYEVKPLMEICLFNIINQLSATNAVMLFEWSDRFEIPDLKTKSWILVKRCVLKITFKLKEEPLPVSKIHKLLEMRRKEKELLDNLKAESLLMNYNLFSYIKKL